MPRRSYPRAYDRRSRRDETAREVEAWLAAGAPDDDPPPFPDPLLGERDDHPVGTEERVAKRLGLDVADLPGWGTAIDPENDLLW